ncbi:MAG: zinc-finger domain-containing protein [Gammaproteobacteria bacterium]|nr:zinc-finger domain-containing protein [Gammaproteobacteria bacterium]
MPNPQTANQVGLQQPNAKNRYEVQRDDMPVHCPMPGSSLWNSHPQVFIAFDANGRGKCPYCGADYQLKD